MNIFLTNDDGINADGIWSLYDTFTKAGHNVWLVAPKYEQSAKSHAITTREPLRIEKQKDQVYSVSGTPADCVLLGFEKIITTKIDLVISGINAGHNLGDDIFYSGTVAAAVEAAFYGVKSIAISITSYTDQKYETASRVLLDLINVGISDFIEYRQMININVPNIAYEALKGYVVCQAGFRRYQNIVHTHKDPRGNDIYWMGGENPIIDKSEYEIDSFAIKEDKVAISPLYIDLNDYKKIAPMMNWLEKINKK